MKKLILVLAVLVALPAVTNAKKQRARNKARIEVSIPVEAKFVRDSARITGKIEGYNPNFPFKTGQMLIQNPFTGEDKPQVFDIADDGTFETTFPVWYDGLTAMSLGGKYMKFYVEPGKTLEITFVRAEPQFAGESAEVNTEMAAFKRVEVPREQVAEIRNSTDWKMVQDAYRKVMDDNLHELDKARVAGTISLKSYEILRNIEISEFISDVLGYASSYRWKNPNSPLPAEFHAFIRDMPLDDPALLAAAGYILVNRIAFMDPLSYKEKAKGIVIQQTKDDRVSIYLPTFIEDKRDELTEDELWYLTTPMETALSDSLLKKKYLEIQSAFAVRYMELAKEHSRTRRYSPEVDRERHRLAYADSAYRALTGREPGLIMDAVAVNALSYVNRYADRLTASDVLQLHRAIAEHVENPFLNDEVWLHYESIMPRISDKPADPLESRRIPTDNISHEPIELEGRAADIMRGIIGRFKGKPVLVDFWGTTCAPCRVNLLLNREERMEVESKDAVKLVYVTHPGQSPNVAEYEKFIADNIMGNSFRITRDEWNILSQPLQLNAIPRYILFDAKGRIINFRHDGSVSEFLRE